MGVDQYRVCELCAAGPDGEGSGSGYRLGNRLVLTARHVIAPALAGPDSGVLVLVRPVGVAGWLPARVEWEDAETDAVFPATQDVHDGDVRGGHVDSGIPGIWRRAGGHGGADLVMVSRRGEQLAAVSVADPVAGMVVHGTGGR